MGYASENFARDREYVKNNKSDGQSIHFVGGPC